MKRVGIVTLAGRSSRFSKSVGFECHKSFFSESDTGPCLLDWQLSLLRRFRFDHVVLVGGYLFKQLESIVKTRYATWPITLVHNTHYLDLGSCYSLSLGIDAIPNDATSVVFLEGDLLFDEAGFGDLVCTEDDAITATNSIIDARTSVAFYISQDGHLRYVYDGSHVSLKIDEAFTMIGNSGQVWQFADVKRLKAFPHRYSESELKGTNLVPILDYYSDIDAGRLRITVFNVWFNCNTIEDYRAMKAYVTGGRS